MKTIKKLLVLGLVGLFVMSCGKDEPASLSKDKAEQAFASVNDDVGAELSALTTAPGYTALNSLSGLNSGATPFGRLKSVKPKDVSAYIKTSLSSVRSILQSTSQNGRVSSSEPFVYDDHVGVYTYNFETDVFDYAPNGTTIKILFPTDGSITNDAEFEMTAYEEVQDSNLEYNPTVVNATIKVEDELQAQIDLTASYDSDGVQTKANLHLYINPYTITLLYDNTASNATAVSFTFTKGTTVIIDAGIAVTYTDKATTDISKITGHVQLMNIRFDANITQDSQVVTIKVDGANAGKIVPDENTGDPYVQYNDGTSVPLEDVFGDLTTQLQGLG